MVVRVGLIGTSWWADAMYAPPLAAHEQAVLVAVTGRNPATTAAFADRWGAERRFDDPIEMLDDAELDAVVVASSNDSHYPLTMAALDRGLHVLCEKPLAQNAVQAQMMAKRAAEKGAITLVPFTYHYMPVNQWVRRLIADGYVGRPYHVNLRYYTGYAHDSAYSWRFDRELAGSGVIGDLGSHWIHLARWLLDDTEVSVGALAAAFVEREPRPGGGSYEQAEDSAVLTVRYESGAYAVLQACAVSWEGTPFNQTHHLEVHGDAGTIYAVCDWDTVQEVRGVRRGERGPAALMPIPDDIWSGVRRDSVHDTYRDVFRGTDAMTRGWITAITEHRHVRPDFADGLAVQRVVDAAVASADAEGVHVPVKPVALDGE
jgi:predicted dehydrogenase